MVMMGKGTDMIGLADLNIANKLYLLMAGGHRTADMVSNYPISSFFTLKLPYSPINVVPPSGES